ncbi:ester cyclase [Sphingorhabdus contaminans]|uniref:nuclear transport factor 2 family protein n=1 Tax=Sphingorhabdus contaminans TaxID=1343899 RepID=UPI003D2C528B
MTLDKITYWNVVNNHRDVAEAYRTLTERLYAKDCNFNAGAPIDHCAGRDAIIERFWQPLVRAFPDLERRTDILLGGQFKDGEWITTTGNFVGHFQNDLFGLTASGRPHFIRYGWFDRIVGDQVVESYVLLDLTRLMIETNQWPLRPQLGESWSPAPATQDGIILSHVDEAESKKSLKLVEAMIAGLMSYDGKTLTSMGMRRFWTPQFQWYGPGGIGSARGHADYERAHQGPFLKAFPDRIGGNHKCRIGEGTYVASTGWPSINATHLGDDWIGIPATGKRITQRIMDYWRREGGMLVENWVFIDMVDLIGQFGIDLLPNWERQLP